MHVRSSTPVIGYPSLFSLEHLHFFQLVLGDGVRSQTAWVVAYSVGVV